MNAKKLLALFIIAISISASAQVKNYTPINYGPKNYGMAYDAENHAIAQNALGIMYFGTANAIWEFDGQTWRRIEVKQGVWVKSILTSASCDTIFIGAQNEFGYLVKNNSNTNFIYTSLADSVRQLTFQFTDIWKIFKCDGNVYFQSYEYIFKFDGKNISIIEPETVFHNAFCANSNIYARQRDIGLVKINNNQSELVTNGKIFAKIGIFGIIDIDTDKQLIISYENGTWIMQNDTIMPNKSALNANLKKLGFNVTSCTKINNNTIALGSYDNGVLVVKPDGTIVTHKNTNNGLIDNFINNIFCDREQNIWITTHKGISLLPDNSCLSVFSTESGINGSVYAIQEFDNQLYIGTSIGLTKMRIPTNSSISDNYTQNLFVDIDEIRQSVWSMTECFGNLFVGTDDGLYRINKKQKIEKIADFDSHCITFDANKQILLSGGNHGLAVFLFDNETDKWFLLNTTANGFNVNSIETEVDSLKNTIAWLGSNHQGIVRATIDDFNIKTDFFSQSNGLAQGLAMPIKYNNQILFLNQGGHIFRYFSQEEVAETLADSLKYLATPIFSDAEIDIINNIYQLKSYDSITWVSEGTNIGYYTSGDTTFYNKKFSGIDVGKINTIYTNNNKQVWLGATDGLVLCDNTSNKIQLPYFSINRSLKTGEQELNLNTIKPKIDYKDNTLIFSFAAPWFQFPKSVKFLYQLDGYLDNWQEAESNTATFNQLPEGTYTFKIKARNAFGDESSTTEYTFTIRPPWYRTVAAYLTYLILILLGVIALTKYRTHQLEERNRLLDKEVKRQTKQIEEQLKQIEEQLKQIEKQNISLTDSINYAARIQRQSLPNTDIINKYVSDSFVLFKPRDIVSGDFYWCAEVNNNLIVTAADWTGHGVPGALMSMLGMTSLNSIVKVRNTTTPGTILNDLRASIIRSFADKGENAAKDGMDICLITIDRQNMKLHFAGAYNPLLQIRNGVLTEYKVDRFPCALMEFSKELTPFSTQTIDIEEGDCYYFFSDGYCDQFGGEGGMRKFMKSRFKQLLTSIYDKPMAEQCEILNRTHIEFKGNIDQIDDILVIGIRI